MIVLNRLFACYYFFSLHLRKNLKTRTDDDQAMILVVAVIIQLFFIVLKIIGGNDKRNLTYSKPLSVGAGLLLIFIANKYFVSNLSRKNRIIDEYKNLLNYKKNLWMIFSLSLFFGPLFYLIFW